MVTLHRFLPKSYTDLSQGNLTPVPQEVLHELIPKKPYTGSLSPDVVLHGLVIKKPYTGSLSPDVVLHGLVTQKPYTGSLFLRMQFYTDSSPSNPTQVSFFPRCGFTRAHHQATLHRFPLSAYKNYSPKISPGKWNPSPQQEAYPQ